MDGKTSRLIVGVTRIRSLAQAVKLQVNRIYPNKGQIEALENCETLLDILEDEIDQLSSDISRIEKGD